MAWLWLAWRVLRLAALLATSLQVASSLLTQAALASLGACRCLLLARAGWVLAGSAGFSSLLLLRHALLLWARGLWRSLALTFPGPSPRHLCAEVEIRLNVVSMVTKGAHYYS